MLDRSSRLADVPGLVHGFSDRNDGVSVGRFASLNLGRRWGDDPDAVEENWARLARAGGFEAARVRTVHQVHGAAVAWAHALPHDRVQADAIACRRGDALVVGVLTADCVPVLLADREGTVAAAVHSGWRGTVSDVVGATVRSLGVPADALLAAIGPCIERAAFEVGEEVAQQFDARFVDRSGARPHVDLVATVRAQLVAAGVPADAIERVGGCTHRNDGRWFSYRRDGAGIGQMLAFAGYVR